MDDCNKTFVIVSSNKVCIFCIWTILANMFYSVKWFLFDLLSEKSFFCCKFLTSSRPYNTLFTDLEDYFEWLRPNKRRIKVQKNLQSIMSSAQNILHNDVPSYRICGSEALTIEPPARQPKIAYIYVIYISNYYKCKWSISVLVLVFV